MPYLLAQDAPNGKQGKAFITVDGENHLLFGLKKIQTDVEIQKSDFKVVGTTTVQSKVTGAKKTGTATITYGTPYFVQMVANYEKTGKLPAFDLQIENDDPATTIGRQTVAYYGCILDKVPVSILDADADELDVEISFTYTSFEVLDSFTDPENLG